ncbi:hypothetical protein PV325_005607 [Microctonus aethiopoides]|uniref:phytanoyl-CoA dioxygenase n=1 Tax=Microctonus aethiopoides TaxID=144406 RepID=A0AA39CA32_9HYME|nr:hypothetical protein PV325_005607 [Microctonus aethiopoides]KAK0160705.1 hypothetical protein PV328_008088 [Microctonus aethiopoides]
MNESRTMSRLMKHLVLTNDLGNLTINQRFFYETNGYLMIPKLISSDVLDKCSRRFDELAAGKIEQGQIIIMRDVTDRKSVNKVQDINHDPVFREYIENKAILDIAQAFTGPNIMAMHSMLIAKPPDAGSNSSRHPPHQDLYYFPFRPADRIVAAWTAIEPCDKENGCLFVSPGSHIPRELYMHSYPKDSNANNKFYHGIQDLPESTNWIDLEMEPGDTVFFHPHLIHGSGVNKSTRTRKAISCHYADAGCNYIDVRGTIQEPIRNEVIELVKKKFPGVELEYQQIWSLKSTLVRGVRSSL